MIFGSAFSFKAHTVLFLKGRPRCWTNHPEKVRTGLVRPCRGNVFFVLAERSEAVLDVTINDITLHDIRGTFSEQYVVYHTHSLAINPSSVDPIPGNFMIRPAGAFDGTTNNIRFIFYLNGNGC